MIFPSSLKKAVLDVVTKTEEDGYSDSIIFKWYEGSDDIDLIKKQHKSLKSEVSKKYGLPAYDGDGGACLGYAGPSEESGINRYHLNKSIELSYWKAGSLRLFVVVTGHDGETLIQLTLIGIQRDRNEFAEACE